MREPDRRRAAAASVAAALVALAVAAGSSLSPAAGAEGPAAVGEHGGATPAAGAEGRASARRLAGTPRSDPAGRRGHRGDAVPGEVIVKWEAGTSAQQRAGARRAEGLSRATGLDLIGAEVAEFPPERGDPAHVAARVARDPRVAYAESNVVVGAHAVPDDPEFDQLWGLHNTGQTVEGEPGVAGVHIDALDAWETTRGDPDVTVAVVDTGTDIDHPDLAGNIWTNPDEALDGTDTDGNGYVDDLHGWDFFHDDETVFDPGESDSHGTHVSGTVAATADNATGVAGAAPGVSLMPLKFLGPGGAGDVAAAITALEYAADEGADVVNASWGGPDDSQALRDAIEASGTVFVTAAGNQGEDNDATPTYPCNFDLAALLCVAAVGNAGGLADFSNTGAESVDVGAPGVSVLATVPRGSRAPVALEITDTGYEAMLWGFGLQEAVGQAARADLLDRALGGHLGVAPDDPVLLVDDDESDSGRWPDTRPYYTEALGQAGYADVTVEEVTTDQSGPDATRMQGNTVVWFTGYAFGHPDGPTTLTTQDRAELVQFLDGGGELLLAGEDAVHRVEGSTLVTDYLHADVGEEATGRHADGGDSSVYAGEGYDLTGSESPFEIPSPFLTSAEPASPAAVEALVLPALPYTDAYAYADGTSTAAPYASGAAALVASQAPTRAPADVVDGLRDSAAPLASLEGVTVTGGMVDAAGALVETAPEVPGAPTDVTALAGDAQATVSWQPPDDDGGSAITAYTVTAEPGGATVTVDGDDTEVTVGGLANGTRYAFQVAAANEVGTGPVSDFSNPVTPTASEPPVACDPDLVPPAGFADVTEDNTHRQAIDCVVWYEVALGTTATTYAPALPVRRDQMAAFVARAVDVSDAELPAAEGDGFDDLAGNLHADNIERLAEAGIVFGVTEDLYDPGATVTRAQMASFLARAYAFVAGPLPVTDTAFTDVAGNTHEDNIARVAGAGIALGTTPTTYEPSQPVRRDQMASFLARTLDALAFEGHLTPRQP